LLSNWLNPLFFPSRRQVGNEPSTVMVISKFHKTLLLSDKKKIFNKKVFLKTWTTDGYPLTDWGLDGWTTEVKRGNSEGLTVSPRKCA
jgi:hypothetical protein